MKVQKVNTEGIFLNVKIRMWGASSKVEKDKLGSLPSDIVKATQALILEEDKEKLEQLGKIKTKVTVTYLNSVSFPFPVLGFVMVPRERVMEIDRYLEEVKKEFFEVVDGMDIEKYKENFKAKHPKYYKPNKYPSQKYFRSHFAFEWSFKDLSPSDSLKSIDPKLYKEEQDKFKEDIKQMEEDTINLISNDILMRVNNLKDMCSGKKRISQRTINGLESLLEKWDMLWKGFISNDALKEAIAKIKENIVDLNADDLRFDRAAKRQVKKAVTEIIDTVQTEVENIGKRDLVF